MKSGEMTREDVIALNAYLVRGMNFRQVYEETGVTRGRLRILLDREDVRNIMKEQQEEFQQQLNTMQDLVLDNIREMLVHPNAKIRLDAIEKWARMNGKYKDNLNITDNQTAEDLAKALIAQGNEDKINAGTEVTDS